MLSVIALAQPGGNGAPGGGAGGLGFFLPMLLIFAVFYLLILRPQSKRQKEHQKMLEALRKGDEIVTSGGIHGTIQRVSERDGTLVVQIAEGVRIEVDRSAVARKVGGAAPE